MDVAISRLKASFKPAEVRYKKILFSGKNVVKEVTNTNDRWRASARDFFVLEPLIDQWSDGVDRQVHCTIELELSINGLSAKSIHKDARAGHNFRPRGYRPYGVGGGWHDLGIADVFTHEMEKLILQNGIKPEEIGTSEDRKMARIIGIIRWVGLPMYFPFLFSEETRKTIMSVPAWDLLVHRAAMKVMAPLFTDIGIIVDELLTADYRSKEGEIVDLQRHPIGRGYTLSQS